MAAPAPLSSIPVKLISPKTANGEEPLFSLERKARSREKKVQRAAACRPARHNLPPEGEKKKREAELSSLSCCQLSQEAIYLICCAPSAIACMPLLHVKMGNQRPRPWSWGKGGTAEDEQVGEKE